jgi:hypothetical protein
MELIGAPKRVTLITLEIFSMDFYDGLMYRINLFIAGRRPNKLNIYKTILLFSVKLPRVLSPFSE